MFDRNGSAGDLSGVVIFTGPSLHPDEARDLVKARVLRDDLDRAVRPRPGIVGIIDGEFYQSLAVSPKEILPLLDSGVKVYGASSMSALRAVELCKYGRSGWAEYSGCFAVPDFEASPIEIANNANAHLPHAKVPLRRTSNCTMVSVTESNP
jgi:hypothetical protein